MPHGTADAAAILDRRVAAYAAPRDDAEPPGFPDVTSVLRRPPVLARELRSIEAEL
jgi:hypothetical protein